jgi:RHS repeat-associated protein
VVTDTYDYDAFGNKLNSTGSTPNNYLYRGEQYDPDLGLYYLRARYYNPATGRFLGRDPEDGDTTDPKTLHKYLYANGDPVNRLDPRGRAGIMEYGAILVDYIGDEAAAVIYEKAEEHVLYCIAFELLLEEKGLGKPPWWYCPAGGL